MGTKNTAFRCVKRYFFTADFNHLPMSLAAADGVVTATKAPYHLITGKTIEEMATIRLTLKKQLFMDFSVPRNIEPSIQYIEGIQVFDMDQISFRLEEADLDKDKVVRKIKVELSEEVAEFKQWYLERKAVPYLQELNEQMLNLKELTLTSLENKLPELTQHQIRLIDKHMQSMINQMKRIPVESLKEFARKNASKESKKDLKLFAKSLGLSVELENSEQPSEVLVVESGGVSIESHETI